MQPVFVIVTLGVILVFGSIVEAEEHVDAKAEATFKEGIEHFKRARYDAAAAAFQRANTLKPNWKIQYNIGQSEAAAKRYGLALQSFEKYMAEGGDDIPKIRQAEVIAEILRLRVLVGSLEINAPEGAMVTVDGIERGRTPLTGLLLVAAGVDHRVVVKHLDKILLDRAVNVSGSRSVVFTVEEAAEPAAQEKESIAPPLGDVEEISPLKTSGWVLLGVGAAALVGGVITGAMTASKANELEDKCPKQQCSTTKDLELKDSVDTLALTTDVLLPLGGAIAVTGVVLLIVGYKNPEAQEQRALSIMPRFSAGSGGVVLEGRF